MPEPVVVRWLLGADGPDAGCDASGDRLDAYVEAEVAGRPVTDRFPDVVGHLANCPDCAEDHDALVALVEALLDESGKPTPDEGGPTSTR
jgi:hypothetical protein